MKRIFIAICFLLIANIVHATEHGLVINLGSRHLISNDTEYNEENYGLGYTRYFDGTAVQLGFYDNSINNWTTYATYKVYGFESLRVKPFVMVGIATGYEISVAPLFAVGTDIEIIKTHKLNFIVAPLVSKTTNNEIRKIILIPW